MKRKNYKITINDKQVAIRHAWNSAKRHIPGLLRSWLEDGQTAILKDEETVCTVDNGHQWCKQKWVTLLTLEHQKETVFNVEIRLIE